jgi:flagellar hook-associated protein 2
MADSLSSLGGVASNIDFRALVDQIIKIERRQADRLQATVDANTKRKDAFNQLQTLVGALKTAAGALRDGAPFDTFTAAVQGTDGAGRALVAATAGAGASPGSYSLEVRALAAAQKNVGSVGFGTGALGLTGAFTINGGANTVTLDGTETLAGVRDEINALAAQTGVRATIVSAGAGDDRLVLTGARSGVAGAFALADVASTPPGPSVVDALGVRAATVAARDAEVVIDGAVTVRRPTNVVADAIPGVSLSLLGAEVGRTATLTVARQASATADAAKKFADAYNAVQNFVRQSTGKDGALASDALTRSVRAELARTLVGTGADVLPDDLTSLGALGFSVAKDGTVSVDQGKLDALAGSRLDDLRAVLADRMGAFVSYAEPIAQAGGTLDTRENGLDAANGRLDARIKDVDARLEKKRAALLAQWSRFEATLGRLNSISDQLGSQLKSLSQSKDD